MRTMREQHRHLGGRFYGFAELLPSSSPERTCAAARASHMTLVHHAAPRAVHSTSVSSLLTPLWSHFAPRLSAYLKHAGRLQYMAPSVSRRRPAALPCSAHHRANTLDHHALLYPSEAIPNSHPAAAATATVDSSWPAGSPRPRRAPRAALSPRARPPRHVPPPRAYSSSLLELPTRVPRRPASPRPKRATRRHLPNR